MGVLPGKCVFTGAGHSTLPLCTVITENPPPNAGGGGLYQGPGKQVQGKEAQPQFEPQSRGLEGDIVHGCGGWGVRLDVSSLVGLLGGHCESGQPHFPSPGCWPYFLTMFPEQPLAPALRSYARTSPPTWSPRHPSSQGGDWAPGVGWWVGNQRGHYGQGEQSQGRVSQGNTK